MKHLVFALATLMILSACSPESPRVSSMKSQTLPNPKDTAPAPDAKPIVTPPDVVVPAPEVPEGNKVTRDQLETITLDGGQSQFDFNPKVDILFVIDNSDSMTNKQENLFRSIDSFVAGFKKNKMIDYHLGVVSVWDSSERFATTKKDQFGAGELRFAKDTNGRQLQTRFVSRQTTSAGLAASLKLAAVAYKDGGPENEESFTPILQAIEKTGRGAVNEGFFRPEAQLVIVLLTDADDASSYQADYVTRELVEFKGGQADKVSVYAALVPQKKKTMSREQLDQLKDYALRVRPDYNPKCYDMTVKPPVENGSCKDGLAPNQLIDFVLQANNGRGTPDEIKKNYIIDITQTNFGPDLGRIGQDITKKVLEKEILLDQRPRLENGQLMITVRYGTPAQLASGTALVIPYAAEKGWQFDPNNNSIRLSGDIDYGDQEGARFSVTMTPVLIK